MSNKSKRMAMAIGLILTFATSQVFVSVGFAKPVPKPLPLATKAKSEGIQQGATSVAMPQGLTGILTTKGNKPVNVNGASAMSGATIVSGAAIETPDEISATLSLGVLGTLYISPRTKLSLTFQNGSVKVMVTEGCVTVRTKQGTTGEIYTPNGAPVKTDPGRDGSISNCPNRMPTAAAASAGGLFGLGTAATVAIVGSIGAAAVLIPVAIRGGNNPSPSTP